MGLHLTDGEVIDGLHLTDGEVIDGIAVATCNVTFQWCNIPIKGHSTST